MTQTPRILVVDDDDSLRSVLAFALREDGHEVEEAEDGRAGLELYEKEPPDLVITDLKMPHLDGMELLAAISRTGNKTPVIVLTALGTVEHAVQAMKLGAFNYLTKPYDREELRVLVTKGLERATLLAENRDLRRRLTTRDGAPEPIFVSSVMATLFDTVRRVAPTDATVLVTGESGTGKELVAHFLHRHSDRAGGPFVAINCGALPRELIESELFGHKRGAFTGATRDRPGRFQAASGGTLLLDEIGDLPADLQSKLLRVLETGQVDVLGGGDPLQVDVRLVAATNLDLGRAVSQGEFREDLFYRLNVIPLHVPPLRERREDVPVLWQHFVRRFAGDAEISSSPDLLAALERLPWAGNVRELSNLCQRMVLLRQGDTLSAGDLPAEAAATPPAPATTSDSVLRELPEGSLPLKDVEREIIRQALVKFDGNKSRTAKYLHVPRHVLLYRIEKYDLEPPTVT